MASPVRKSPKAPKTPAKPSDDPVAPADPVITVTSPAPRSARPTVVLTRFPGIQLTLEKKWEKHKFESKLINPANRRKYEIIVVGSGLAGASAASTLADMGYKVKCFCYQDSPRRAHSIAAQGGINAAKNYPNDGDSVFRLFYDTIKGGDFRSREANVYRLAEVSSNIIDQCVAQGVPFASRIRRPVGQSQLWRRPGLAHLLRARPDRPAAPHWRLLRAFPPNRRGHGDHVSAHRDARSRARRRPRQGHRRP